MIDHLIMMERMYDIQVFLTKQRRNSFPRSAWERAAVAI
jgi:hypothetical protein